MVASDAGTTAFDVATLAVHEVAASNRTFDTLDTPGDAYTSPTPVITKEDEVAEANTLVGMKDDANGTSSCPPGTTTKLPAGGLAV